MKKFLLKLLFNKRQREIIWQAMIFSEHTYRRRGNINNAAVVQTVINETESAFNVVKNTYTKEEVDFIVANVLRDAKVENDKQIKIAYEKGVDSCRKELENAYNRGYEDRMKQFSGIAVIREVKCDEDMDAQKKDDSADLANQTTVEDVNASDTPQDESTDTNSVSAEKE